MRNLFYNFSPNFLSFSFADNISTIVLDKLAVNRIILQSNIYSIEDFLKELVEREPIYILGLGMYSGRDKDKLRIEQITKNKFRNNIIVKNPTQIELSYFISPTYNMKLTFGMGNSWCNLISYKIMYLIKRNKIDTHYTFIHIPKSFDANLAVDEISSQLYKLT